MMHSDSGSSSGSVDDTSSDASPTTTSRSNRGAALPRERRTRC